MDFVLGALRGKSGRKRIERLGSCQIFGKVYASRSGLNVHRSQAHNEFGELAALSLKEKQCVRSLKYRQKIAASKRSSPSASPNLTSPRYTGRFLPKNAGKVAARFPSGDRSLVLLFKPLTLNL